MINLPLENRQKFQVGDICKIIRADNTFCYPPEKDEETEGYGAYVMILNSYAQSFPHIMMKFSDYSIFIPKSLNPDLYDEHDWYHGKDISYRGEFGWAWVTEAQLEFVRKPTDEEVEHMIKYENPSWERCHNNNSSIWTWKNYEHMLQEYNKVVKESTLECKENQAKYKIEKILSVEFKPLNKED